jgi:hypothetical protein
MMELAITRGLKVIVDDDDYPGVAAHHWQPAIVRGCIRGVQRVVYLGGGKRDPIRQTLQLHRSILGVTDPAILVDHKDGNPLNNVRSNLRIATRAQNGANRSAQAARKRVGGGYIGVCLCVHTGRWVAHLKVNQKNIWLGRHATAEAAAQARDAAALLHHGEFAALNFPKTGH